MKDPKVDTEHTKNSNKALKVSGGGFRFMVFHWGLQAIDGQWRVPIPGIGF